MTNDPSGQQWSSNRFIIDRQGLSRGARHSTEPSTNEKSRSNELDWRVTIVLFYSPINENLCRVSAPRSPKNGSCEFFIPYGRSIWQIYWNTGQSLSGVLWILENCIAILSSISFRISCGQILCFFVQAAATRESCWGNQSFSCDDPDVCVYFISASRIPE